MNREDIIRMARGANILEPLGYDCPDRKNWRDDVVHSLAHFAALIAAAEREACARVCEEMFSFGALEVAAAIRARGDHAQEK